MGKLTQSQADELKKAGILSTKVIKNLQDNDAISEGRKSTKRYMKTSDGAWVSPQFYFEGVSKHKYSKKMSELKEAVEKVINKFTTDQK
jgi:hypothetical protein